MTPRGEEDARCTSGRGPFGGPRKEVRREPRERARTDTNDGVRPPRTVRRARPPLCGRVSAVQRPPRVQNAPARGTRRGWVASSVRGPCAPYAHRAGSALVPCMRWGKGAQEYTCRVERAPFKRPRGPCWPRFRARRHLCFLRENRRHRQARQAGQGHRARAPERRPAERIVRMLIVAGRLGPAGLRLRVCEFNEVFFYGVPTRTASARTFCRRPRSPPARQRMLIRGATLSSTRRWP